MKAMSNSTQEHQGADQPAAAPNPELEQILDLLLGNELADELMFPKNKRYGILFQYRIQARYNRIMNRYLPRLATVSDIDRFSGMLGVSVYDEGGISYRLPDHVYSEESSAW